MLSSVSFGANWSDPNLHITEVADLNDSESLYKNTINHVCVCMCVFLCMQEDAGHGESIGQLNMNTIGRVIYDNQLYTKKKTMTILLARMSKRWTFKIFL